MLFKFVAVLSLAASTISIPLQKRGGSTCKLPSGKGLVEISGDDNAGWAMSSDQTCDSGDYCPYACPSGKLMAQWDKSATSYSYPESQNGGLYCNSDGSVSKPISGSDYCEDGEDTVYANNTMSKSVAFCQTVLPGNEDMLIPTSVDSDSEQKLAVPGPEYWANTSAHYYINPPGVSTDDACTWGSSSKAQGNWAPYVAGANTDSDGSTYVKIGWNPKYVEDFDNQKPSFGIKITCDDESSCNGLDCEINPSKDGFNKASGSSSDELEGAAYCVVTATDKSKARIVVFST